MIVKRTVLAALLLGFCVNAASTCRAALLSDLFAGGTITADDKLFSNWRILISGTLNGGIIDPTQINVTALVDDPLNPGIRFTAPEGALGTPFTHTGPSAISFVFAFDVSTTNQLPLIKDNSLRITDWTFDAGPGAVITIREQVSNVAGTLGEKQVQVNPDSQPGDPTTFDTAAFSPQAFVNVIKTIAIQGSGNNDGAFLTGFEQRFSQVDPVPEPSSLTLGAMLLVCGLGRAMWRRARSR